jgi:hypothetical protein
MVQVEPIPASCFFDLTPFALPTQIPLVKTVYALIWEPRMHAISELESRFSDHDYEGRLELTKRFWEDEWPDTNPAGRRWRQIIKLAASGQDPFPYDELCDMLAVHVPACA